MFFFALLLPLAFAQRGMMPPTPVTVEINPMVNDGSCTTQREMCVRMEPKCSKEWIMCMFGGRCMPIDFQQQTQNARKCKEFVRNSCTESIQPELEEACVFHTMGITVIGVNEVECTQQVHQSSDELKRRANNQDWEQMMCSQERVRSLYGVRCRARQPIHQLRNLESCRREFRNACPLEKREQIMAFCEIETGIVPQQWLNSPSMWPQWLTTSQQPMPFYPQQQSQMMGGYGGPHRQYDWTSSTPNPYYYPQWMSGSRRHQQQNPWMMNQQYPYGHMSTPYGQQGQYNPICEQMVRKTCQMKYGGQQQGYGQEYNTQYDYPYGQSSMYGQSSVYGPQLPWGGRHGQQGQQGQQYGYGPMSGQQQQQYGTMDQDEDDEQYQQQYGSRYGRGQFGGRYGQQMGYGSQYGRQGQYGQYPQTTTTLGQYLFGGQHQQGQQGGRYGVGQQMERQMGQTGTHTTGTQYEDQTN